MARRFRIYFFGFVLGCIIVYSSLIKGRTKELLGWLPGYRVLYELEVAPRKLSDKAACQLKCLSVGESFLKEVFDNGEVDFSRSRPKENPRVYLIEIEKSNINFEVQLSFADSITTIVSIEKTESNTNCECN